MSDNERSRGLAEFLDMHIISTNMVSFDSDPDRKGLTYG